MNFVVVEPHSDDAFLGLHAHILKWVGEGNSVHIVTLEDDPRRSIEAAAYAKKVGATWSQKPSAGQLILPLGIKHPDHVSARRELETPDAWFYVDMPYALVQRDADMVNDLLRGMEVVSFLKPHGNKWQNIKIFESQSSYFSFRDRDQQLKNSGFELIVRQRQQP